MPSGDLNQKLSELSDEELAVRSKADSSALAYLVSRFTKPVLAKACSFAAKYPADADDLLQEGLLAVIKAAETFDPGKGVKFATYADVCTANRMKNVIAKHVDITTDEELTDDEADSSSLSTPEDILIEREKMKELYDTISSLLSHKEWKIFGLFLNGCSYSQIAKRLNVSEKSVDNSLMRTRRKLRAALPKLF